MMRNYVQLLISFQNRLEDRFTLRFTEERPRPAFFGLAELAELDEL